MEIVPTNAALGASIHGLDISRPIADDLFASVLDAFHRHQVLVFKNQDVSPEAQIAFSCRFGVLEDQLNARFTLPEHPEVLILSNDMKDGQPVGVIDGGDYWHSDSSHRDLPSMATVLFSVKNPDRGGDTEFANMYAAYDALSDEMKSRLTGLRAIHAVSKLRNKRVTVSPRRPDAYETYTRQNSVPDVIHPIVRTHPATGRKALFISERFTIGIEGMDESDADPILDELFAHQISREFVYRHKWDDGDLVIWDNRCVMHRAMGGYRYPDVRRMHRTVVQGDTPF
ncbi:MAG: hypothetical protein RLZ98_2379 [Pseudomonadota bacterium]|jgi:taurine dioxygenase